MIAVVAGIITGSNDTVMLCQRKPTSHLGLKWEFPGGKLEPGESPEQALRRELNEELGIDVEVMGIYDAKIVPREQEDLLILFYFAKILSGVPKPIDCNDIVWTKYTELTDHDLAPTDLCIAERLCAERRQNG